MSYSMGNESSDRYNFGYSVQNSYDHNYLSDCHAEESNFWSNSPRSDSPSPSGAIQSPVLGPYQIYGPIQYASDHRFRNAEIDGSRHIGPPYVRVVKRRTTANKKERRRTQSINNAYADLRDCIPNVPADTKLSKIKTLRLATSYILYLIGVLETDEPAGGFRAELGTLNRKSSNGSNGNEGANSQQKSDISEDMCVTRRAKGRTGWPQHVWALELKQEHPNGM